MTAGDVVLGLSTNNAVVTFTPAAGVEVMITYICSGNKTNDFVQVIVGGARNAIFGLGNAGNVGNGVNNIPTDKLFLNDTTTLQIDPLGAGRAGMYTGLQIK